MHSRLIPTRQQIAWDQNDGVLTCANCGTSRAKAGAPRNNCPACGYWICRACAAKLRAARQDCACCRRANANEKIYKGSWHGVR
jgi:hypothetical protein